MKITVKVVRERALVLLSMLLIAVAGWAQQSQLPEPVPKRPPAGVQNEPPSATGEKPHAGQQGAQAEDQKAEPEQKISPEEAKALFRSVDEILQFVSKDTGLPIKHEVKRKLASREEVQKFIQDRMKDDEDRRRLERSEVVLKKLALLPHDFNLQSFLVDLLKEQVAGFYNTKDKTVYLLDWVEPEAQKPVLAHELTHALQDQNFGLDKWAKAAKSGKAGSPEALMEDERTAARQAVSEGQAMVTLIDYMLAPSGQSLQKAPMIADAVMAGMMQSGQTPLYTKAPMFLRELLVFPYQFGLKFERDVMVAKGMQGAFAEALERPPADTHQVMEPSTYLHEQQVPLVSVPSFESAAGNDYQKYDLSVMGEFDVWLVMKQYSNQQNADAISPKWRGGYYYAALKPGTPKSDPGSAVVSESAVALAYISHWADADAAGQFAATYAGYLPKRYAGAKELPHGAWNDPGYPGPPADKPAQVKVDVAERLKGAHSWQTDQGVVSLDVQGNTVLILEGFDDAAAGRIRTAVFAGH